MRITIALLFVWAGLSVTASADDIPVIPPVVHEVEGEFDDIAFGVENAIINAGLVIETRSHAGEMLARTKEDVGGSKDIYSNAEIFTFCSARVSREVMEIDPMNIQFCPYSIFLYETPDAPGKIIVGHPGYVGSMAPVQELLDGILADALMLE
ncbi:DUF302 domain-containing protein [Paracoccus alkanivorans]|uniref:DUF302 domain-containing protein n=1 Tax=Paracoccus alkanivorans TaxID=2116655 RepID=A0A3M0MHX4_9RHOB|nr:DUF302 domain-containing protein [Paracoccus alkanivorans]RMC35824.1 DUF302 domain-containing protein [Paracoccus alkanivorans]